MIFEFVIRPALLTDAASRSGAALDICISGWVQN